MITVIFIGILGVCVGSFLNVCIYRIPIRKSIVTGCSNCPHCQTLLSWLDKVPLVSFILLRGRCRICRCPISWQYPLVELTTGLLWVTLYIQAESLQMFVSNTLFVSVLIVVAVIDFKHYLIPNKILLFAGFAWIAFALIFGNSEIENFISAIAAALCLYTIALLAKIIFKKEAMGMGDIKLTFLLGLFIGWPVFFIIAGGFMLGGLIGVVGLITGVLRRDSRLPLGCLMALMVICKLVYFDGNLFLNLNF